jgi:hypothetical protein
MLADYHDAREPPMEEEPEESAKEYYDMLADVSHDMKITMRFIWALQHDT